MRKLLQSALILGAMTSIMMSCSNPSAVNPEDVKAESSDVKTEVAFPGVSGEWKTGEALINGRVANISYERVNGRNILEGDIVIPDEDILDNNGSKIRSVVETARLWENNVVHYQIANNVHDENLIREAVAYWAEKSNLTFIESSYDNYIEFIPATGCWSYIGCLDTGRQEIGIADWASKGNVVHEIGHAMGLEHEHTRADRDNTVIINWNNIEWGRDHNFQINNSATHNDVGAFDFNSVMLYPSSAFSIGGPTITRLDGSTFSAQRDSLSPGDLAGVKSIYGQNDAYYKIVSVHSGKVLDVAGLSTENGANIYQWEYVGGDNQMWKFVHAGDGYYTIACKRSGKYLDVSGASTADGANIIQWPSHGGNNQKWKLEHTNNGYYKITSKHSGKVLDVEGASTINGGNIQQWGYGAGNNQKWQLVRVSN